MFRLTARDIWTHRSLSLSGTLDPRRPQDSISGPWSPSASRPSLALVPELTGTSGDPDLWPLPLATPGPSRPQPWACVYTEAEPKSVSPDSAGTCPQPPPTLLGSLGQGPCPAWAPE
jgi:hypothetical protein